MEGLEHKSNTNQHLPQLLEKMMAPHSSTLAWKIPWTEEPGRLQSMGSRRVGHDWATSLCRWHHFYSREWRGTKEPLDESERGDWKCWLKTQDSRNEDHSIQSHHFMAKRWGNNGNSESIFGGSKITADGDCSPETQRCLLLGRNVMNNLESILKNRDITSSTKFLLVRLWFFQSSCMDVRVGL